MSIIKMILLIGLLIFVHEFGHFIVARMFKIKVDKFCFGLPFGPILFQKKIGDVTYGIHWLFFLGGYVSFPDDDKNNNLPQDSPDLFKNRPIYQRALVLIAGVAANFITAYLLILFCCLHTNYLPSGQYDLIVKSISSTKNVQIVNSGLKDGDKIYSINGRKVEYPTELSLAMKLSENFNNKITKKQYDKVLKEFLAINPKLTENKILNKGDIVNIPAPIIEDKVVLSETDIFELNKKEKPIILKENQQLLRNKLQNKSNYIVDTEISVTELVESIADTKAPIELAVKRDNKLIDLKPFFPNAEGENGLTYAIAERINKVNSFKDAIQETNKYIIKNTKLIFWSLKLLVTGQVPQDKVTSIIAITKIGSDVIEKSGIIKGLLLTGIISLNLAILNLMPIPVLDGGHLLFLLIEKIKGSPLNEKFIELCSTIFFYLLIFLMILLILNDIWSIWFKKLY